jgi:3-oxoacid CoA-transferase subunit B
MGAERGLSREMIARRASQSINDGEYVNLGIGLPTHLSNWLAGRDVYVHSEVGMLNVGPLTSGGDCDLFGLTPGCEPVIELPGTAYFDIVESFGMIRAGYLDVSVMGAFQVDAAGGFAGWAEAERLGYGVGNIGGSMDLALGARRLFITMLHTTGDGSPKIVDELSFPATARGCVSLIFTDIAVIRVTPDGLWLDEVYPGLTAADVQAVTGPPLSLSPSLKEIDIGDL